MKHQLGFNVSCALTYFTNLGSLFFFFNILISIHEFNTSIFVLHKNQFSLEFPITVFTLFQLGFIEISKLVFKICRMEDPLGLGNLEIGADIPSRIIFLIVLVQQIKNQVFCWKFTLKKMASNFYLGFCIFFLSSNLNNFQIPKFNPFYVIPLKSDI